MHFYRGSGAGAARYFDEGHRGAEAYYTEDRAVAVEIDTWVAGERAAPTVAAGPGELVRWVEGVDLATGEVKGMIRSGGAERQPLRFVEVVVNNPKSLSVVASQNPAVAAAVDRVLGRQADEICGYLSTVAVTRVGPKGGQVEQGGLRVETARVRHLTSREGDPHRHVHVMVNTRVRTGEGEWRGLHSAAVRQHIRAVNGRAARVLATDAGLREVLGEHGYTLGADGEIDQARGAVAALSKRAVQVAGNRERAEAVWRGEHPGREPSRRVINGWDQLAWAERRKAKPYDRETPEEMSERVRVELADLGFDFTPGRRRGGPDRPGTAAVAPAVPVVSVGQVDRDRAALEAVAVLSGQKSAWSHADLNAEVEAAVARSGVVGDSRAVTELVDDVRARAVGRCVSVLDAGVFTPTVMSRHLTSPQVIDADLRLNLGLAGLAGGRDFDGGRLAVTAGLDAGQGEAVAAVCGGGRLEVVVGPAGTGKTRMLDVANRRLVASGRQMMVVAPTRKAAQVAAGEIGTDGGGVSLSKLVFEHGFRWDHVGRWTRLQPGQTDPGSGRVYEGPGAGWVLSGRSVVVVDEAGLMTVDQANALIDIAAESGAAVRLVGDPRQLGAVGRGGVMETACRWIEAPVVLDQVHRFLTVTVDEAGMPAAGPDVDYADLSLVLRDGQRPGVVVDRLFERDAVRVHASEAAAVAALAAVVAAQGEAVTVTVATNDVARIVNQAIRDLRVLAGEVDDARTAVGMDGMMIGVGDRIVTRRNDTARDVANRETWTVETVNDDGTLTARAVNPGRGGDRRVCLDVDYLAGHTQLGYAATDYGNQGVTTDHAVTWAGDTTTAGGLYVGATRGRHTNTVHVVARDIDDARAQLIAAIGRDRADRGLDAARAHAAAAAVPGLFAQPAAPAAPAVQPPPPARPVTVETGPVVDPAQWRTVAELDAADRAVNTRLEAALSALRDRPVTPDHIVDQQNRADRELADRHRQQATWHQHQAERQLAGRNETVAAVTADFFDARTDAQTIAAGPGRLGRKTSQIEAAQNRRAETARRWSTGFLPGPGWDDNTVRGHAGETARRVVDGEVLLRTSDAGAAAGVARTLDERIAARDRSQHDAREVNQNNEVDRAALNAGAERARVDNTQARDRRAAQTATMTPDQIAVADHARNTYLDSVERARAAQRPGRSLSTQPGRGPTGRAGRRLSQRELAEQHARTEAIRRAQEQRRDGPDRGLGF